MYVHTHEGNIKAVQSECNYDLIVDTASKCYRHHHCGGSLYEVYLFLHK